MATIIIKKLIILGKIDERKSSDKSESTRVITNYQTYQVYKRSQYNYDDMSRMMIYNRPGI